MSLDIQGLNSALRDIESRLSGPRLREVKSQALKAAAQYFIAELKKEFLKFKDTGASIDEMEATEPKELNGILTITVRWRGPKRRYAIIHLNEFGTIKNPNPPGKGSIARVMQSTRREYERIVEQNLRRAF